MGENVLFIILFEFFKVGLFAIGGGLATLPFLYHISVVYHWFDAKDLAQMLAISNIVPGPVGVNLASIVGFNARGVLGALVAVFGIMLPSLIFVFIVSKLLKEFEGSGFIKSIFYMLKPASVAMISAICIRLLFNVIFKSAYKITFASVDWMALILFLSLFVLSFKKNHSPLFYLGISALAGVLVHVIKSFFLG